MRSRHVKSFFTQFLWTETGALPVGVLRAQFARISVGRRVARPGSVQLAEAAAARVWVAGVGGAARYWRCERERESGNESDDLNDATDRHSVGPPRPHRRIFLDPVSRTVRLRGREVKMDLCGLREQSLGQRAELVEPAVDCRGEKQARRSYE